MIPESLKKFSDAAELAAIEADMERPRNRMLTLLFADEIALEKAIVHFEKMGAEMLDCEAALGLGAADDDPNFAVFDEEAARELLRYGPD